ncbi:hypothetical protein FNF29_00224 [Cafeteria roenbergensis]|uniref:Uncharacterized protein n=1 Tax=Cafeteria roenbergensis TaxID=33653 RepID=A0A5A8CXZ2_CAFRO|nr:hypothetical protein FNF29_00224 [Cafeteria roenbergensis]|eukprot:KAA0157648.1 hypothetical protein FNF29_00224 [Cafeteria roenbergensis]
MDTEAMRRLQAVARRSTWQKSFQAFSVAAGGRPELERGDKILLPQSALQELGAMEVEYPLKFRLQSPGMDIVAHCGVREFVAEEGRVYLPFWLLSAIGAGEDCPIVVTNVSLPKATYVKLRPRRMAFVELTDPKGVLEVALREFTCVTQGVAIRIPYIGRTFDIDILEVKPDTPMGGASIVETDASASTPGGDPVAQASGGEGGADSSRASGAASGKPTSFSILPLTISEANARLAPGGGRCVRLGGGGER